MKTRILLAIGVVQEPINIYIPKGTMRRCIDMIKNLSSVFSRFQWSSFTYLNITQFIGGLNDNIIKLLIVFCFIGVEGVEASAEILSSVGIIYVVPFLLFSQTGGIMADRFSKRNIIISMKVLELCVTVLATFAFFKVSKTLSYTALFLLATHSALFGPCKYSIVPEIVPQEKISKANGLLTLCTYSAIILGTFLASFLTDISNRHFVIASSCTSLFAVIGLLASVNIKKTPIIPPAQKAHPFFMVEFFRTIRVILKEPLLFTAVVSSSFFLFVGAFVQLAIIPFSIEHLHLTDVQGGYLFLLTALGIGAGSVMAGKFSGKAVELGLTPLGGFGMSIACFLISHFATSLPIVIVLMVIVGLCGGFYLVPLDSFIQMTSPRGHRGQVLAIVNFLGFVGVGLSAGALYLLQGVLGFPPKTGLAIIAGITFCASFVIMMLTSGYFVRFFAFLVSRVLFRIKLKRSEQIPLYHPSFYLIPYSFWPWAMVLLSSQRRRMRLFSFEADLNPPLLGRIAARFMTIVEVTTPESLYPTGEYGDLVRTALSRGTSIAIFSSKSNFTAEYQKWIQLWKDEMKETTVPFFAVVKPPTQEYPGKLHRGRLSAELNRIA